MRFRSYRTRYRSKSVQGSALRKLVKDDGLVFVSTISKSLRGVLGAIVFAERLAKMVPAGTHDANKFLHPSELAIVLERYRIENKLDGWNGV